MYTGYHSFLRSKIPVKIIIDESEVRQAISQYLK